MIWVWLDLPAHSTDGHIQSPARLRRSLPPPKPCPSTHDRAGASPIRSRSAQPPQFSTRLLRPPRWRGENPPAVRGFFLQPGRLRQFASWFVLGVVAVAVEIAWLGVLYQGLGWPLWLASAVAAETLIIVRFLVADRWVFGHASPALDRCWRYHGASAGAFVVSWVVLNGSAAYLGVPYLAAALLGTGASFVWSLLTNFLWVWKPAPSLVD